MAVNIAAGSRIPVLEPSSADVWGGFDAMDVEAELFEGVKGVEAAEAGADYEGVVGVFGHYRIC
jgi:hypothetical protein